MRAHEGPLLDFAFGRSSIELPEELERLVDDEPRSVLRRGSVSEMSELVDASRGWLARNFGVQLDAESILPVPGGRAAMSALIAAILEPGARVLVTEPGYPAFRRLAEQAHAALTDAPQDPLHNFEPALDPRDTSPYRLLALNYPNNPTGSVASAETLERLVGVCDRDSVIFNDATYAALTFDETGYSLLAAGARIETPSLIELHSLSKLLPLGSMSTAFLAGEPELVRRIRDLGDFAWSPLSSLQARLGRACLEQDDHLRAMCRDVRSRVDRLAAVLDRMGFAVFIPRGGLYMLTRAPRVIDGKSVGTATEGANLLLERHGLAVVPFEVPPDRFLRFSALYLDEDLEQLVATGLSVQP